MFTCFVNKDVYECVEKGRDTSGDDQLNLSPSLTLLSKTNQLHVLRRVRLQGNHFKQFKGFTTCQNNLDTDNGGGYSNLFWGFLTQVVLIFVIHLNLDMVV